MEEIRQDLRVAALEQAVLMIGSLCASNPAYVPIPSEAVNWAEEFYQFLLEDE